jgi:hypothetical protein
LSRRASRIQEFWVLAPSLKSTIYWVFDLNMAQYIVGRMHDGV